jgi:hypothetical protein
MEARAVRWSCARCEVSVGHIDGRAEGLPDTWTRYDGLTYCLSCSRARAGEDAVVSAPESTSREDRARLKRSALIAFEIARTPAAPNRTIANACRTSAMAVAAVRNVVTGDSATSDHAAHGGT